MGIFTDLFTSKDKPLDVELGTALSSPLIKHVRRLPIVMEDELVGIVTAHDLVEAYAK